MAQRRIAIAVDLSIESAFAVQWAVDNYLRPGDSVLLLHVSPTSDLYGADWGSTDLESSNSDDEHTRKKEDGPGRDRDRDRSTARKIRDMAAPLKAARIPFKVHIVKDHDMKERLCLEMDRLRPSAAVMGSRGIGAMEACIKAGLGSVSDYCVRHCVCPVVVVRCPDGAAVVDPVVEMHSGSEIDWEDALGEDERGLHADGNDV